MNLDCIVEMTSHAKDEPKPLLLGEKAVQALPSGCLSDVLPSLVTETRPVPLRNP